MTSDVGITRSVLPPVAQNSPTASVGNVKQDPQREAEAKAARKSEPAESPEALEGMVSDLNQLVQELHRELRFSVDEDSGDTVVKVIDKETDEVLRQIPSQEVMNLRKRLEEAAGVIFQDSA
jgi:flagellar protein FlaG